MRFKYRLERMKNPFNWLFFAIWLVLITARCAPISTQVSPTETLSEQPPSTLPPLTNEPVFESSPTAIKDEAMTAAPSQATPASPVFQGLVEQARADLGERLEIDPDQIVLLEARAVVWPDGSFGCPQPGMAYTQVQAEGALIRLGVGAQVYNYHVGGGEPPFLCEQPLQVP